MTPAAPTRNAVERLWASRRDMISSPARPAGPPTRRRSRLPAITHLWCSQGNRLQGLADIEVPPVAFSHRDGRALVELRQRLHGCGLPHGEGHVGGWRGLPPVHSITSSARASSDGGTVMPSILAVWWLMTSSNLLDCTTGRAAGFAPFGVRPGLRPA